MMKRIVLLFFAIVLLLAGCRKREISTVAVLVSDKTDDAIAVFRDKEQKLIADKKIGYPVYVYFGPDALYYCLNGTDYESLQYDGFKNGNAVKNVNGILMYHKDGQFTFIYDDSVVLIRDADGEIRDVVQFDWAEDFKTVNDKIYIWSSTEMAVFSLTEGKLLWQESFMSDFYRSVVEIDGKVYLATDRGLTEMDNGFKTTFIYPHKLDEIIGFVDNVIVGNEKEELVAYRITVGEYRMQMEPEYDDRYLEGDLDFEKIYAEYYEKGYEVMDYRELSR